MPGFFRVIPMTSDSVQLRSAGRVARIAGSGLGDRLPALLAALDGSATVPELAQRFGLNQEVVERLVTRLHESGILMDGAWDADGPGSEFYAEMGTVPSEVEDRIAVATVAVVGLGPVGRLAARLLASAGVGELRLADISTITPLDQSLLGHDSSVANGDIGRSQAVVAADECRRPGQAVSSATGEDLESLLAGVDLVIATVDEVELRAVAVSRAALAARVPYLFHALTTLEGLVGPSGLPPESPCYECLVWRRASHLRHHEEHVAYQEHLRSGDLPSHAPAPAAGGAVIVAGLVAAEALRVLGRFAVPRTRDGILVADFRTLEVRHEPVLPAPRCPACGSHVQEVALSP